MLKLEHKLHILMLQYDLTLWLFTTIVLQWIVKCLVFTVGSKLGGKYVGTCWKAAHLRYACLHLSSWILLCCNVENMSLRRRVITNNKGTPAYQVAWLKEQTNICSPFMFYLRISPWFSLAIYLNIDEQIVRFEVKKNTYNTFPEDTFVCYSMVCPLYISITSNVLIHRFLVSRI